MLSFLPKNPQDVMEELRVKFKQRRTSMGYTQTECATRSGVSLGSLKRFERTGQISFESLLKLAFVLECLGEFDGVCDLDEDMPKSMDEILKKETE
ncbi:MAG TPA: XRE family transcriptional regulator [Epsilonproteobacteria bacterium]|nr:XRE family transcriptional regulator [Campylobacterota bacterium]